jgi:hypothetical protein
MHRPTRSRTMTGALGKFSYLPQPPLKGRLSQQTYRPSGFGPTN